LSHHVDQNKDLQNDGLISTQRDPPHEAQNDMLIQTSSVGSDNNMVLLSKRIEDYETFESKFDYSLNVEATDFLRRANTRER
jgi:hypothetical protein